MLFEYVYKAYEIKSELWQSIRHKQYLYSSNNSSGSDAYNLRCSLNWHMISCTYVSLFFRTFPRVFSEFELIFIMCQLPSSIWSSNTLAQYTTAHFIFFIFFLLFCFIRYNIKLCRWYIKNAYKEVEKNLVANSIQWMYLL